MKSRVTDKPWRESCKTEPVGFRFSIQCCIERSILACACPCGGQEKCPVVAPHGCTDPGLYSIDMLADSMTLAHLSVSDSMNFAKSSGVPPEDWPPVSSNAFCTSGFCKIAFKTAWSF